MRFLRRSLVGLFLMSLTFGLLAWAGQSVYSALDARWSKEQTARPARERVFSVNVVTMTPTEVTPVLTAFGEVLSRRTLDIRATAAGRIVALADGFENGGTVQQGQLLLRIDPADAQSALDTAQADLQEAEAELRDAVRGLELAKDETALAMAQADLRVQALDRQKALQTRGVGTDATVETAALAAAAANQSVLSRRQAEAQAEARLDQANTGLDRRRIALAEAKRRLADTEIFAGFTGTLGEVAVVEGGIVTANERVAQLIAPDLLEVSFRISTSQYARLLDANGALIRAEIEVALDVLGADLTSKGVISRESAAVGTGQTGRLIFARLDGPKGFRPGDFVTVRINEPKLEDVVVLPASAVDTDATVLVVGDDDRLSVAQVAVIRRQADSIIVRAADLTGQRVVAERSPLLGAGIKVRAIVPEAAVAPEAPAMLQLSTERRARLVAFVEANTQMPKEAKDRVLAQLAKDMVPLKTIERIESRMGG
ncbi:efflux RND transporter periplasmic adaptor subunit [Pseudogemmobacter sp. W21_MBD1_M6]|uniref:efflux RND transporter periplasmic adaptor subunit n=1 Tax=Pseudogemmobacter sp. W21_MBD1_M6 TaxID=3240271 RepID=UPI003F9E1F27